MTSIMQRPLARSERLVIETVGDETVIYDLDTSVAHALKPLAAAVFAYADGSNSPAEIAELAAYRLDDAVTEDQVRSALTELEGLSLLDVPEESGVSRRDALKLFAAAGAGTMLVTSVAAPAAFAGTTQNGYPYMCGTYNNAITGNTAFGFPAVDWPQYNGGTNSGAGCSTNPGGKQYLSSPCYVTPPTSYCSYNGKEVAGVTQSKCSGGFCYDTKTGTECTKSSTQCGGTTDYKWVKGTWVTSGGSKGTYQCVPCDGEFKTYGGQTMHYQCCEVVCVPDGVTVTGAITSSSYPICQTTSGCSGYGPYTNPYGGSWPNKYCTNNPNCNPGNCS